MKEVTKGTNYYGPELISLGPFLIQGGLELIPCPLLPAVPSQRQKETTFLKPKHLESSVPPTLPTITANSCSSLNLYIFPFLGTLPTKSHCRGHGIIAQMLTVNKARSYKDQGHVYLLSARCVQNCAGSTIGNSMEKDISAFKEFIKEKGK